MNHYEDSGKSSYKANQSTSLSVNFLIAYSTWVMFAMTQCFIMPGENCQKGSLGAERVLH